jgi:hypothetical protein
MPTDSTCDPNKRQLRDEELDAIVGGVVASTQYFSGCQILAFSLQRWSPIILPPNPC